MRHLELVNTDRQSLFRNLLYSDGHGATTTSLGLGLIYYVLSCAKAAHVCVCLGSGGGFVPGLMRQAQRELRLTGARTYLVDAILPEAGAGTPEGAGWFSPDSVLRREFPEIVTLSCLTTEAARFFAKNGFRIDYLHIDADHSFESVVSDFSAYEPLLAPHAFVTLHDTSIASVSAALAEIENRFPQYSVLSLPDIGNGLAIARRKNQRVPHESRPDPPLENGAGTPGDNEPSARSSLLHPALQSRHALAAHFVSGVDVLLEVGGYRTPITDFLIDPPRQLLVVDPCVEPRHDTVLRGRPCEIRHLRMDLDAFDYEELARGSFALVFMEMDLYRPDKSAAEALETYTRFIDLVSRAQRTVLEYPVRWEHSKQLFEVMLSVLQPHVVFDSVIDLPDNPAGDVPADIRSEHLGRRLVVIDQMEPVPDRSVLRRRIARSLYGTGADAILAGAGTGLVPASDAFAIRDWQLVYKEATGEFERDVGELTIRTSDKPWSYAVFIPFRRRPDAHAGVIRVTARVDAGVVALGALTQDGSAIVGERFLTARADQVQEVDVYVPDLAACKGFLCRNGQVPGASSIVLKTIELHVAPQA